MWCVNLLLIALIFQAKGAPFLANPAQLITSLFAASSNPQPETNVEFIGKTEKEDEPEDFLIDNFNGTNEASPGIFQKKLGRILQKLQLIAQFKNSLHTVDSDGTDFDQNATDFGPSGELGRPKKLVSQSRIVAFFSDIIGSMFARQNPEFNY